MHGSSANGICHALRGLPGKSRIEGSQGVRSARTPRASALKLSSPILRAARGTPACPLPRRLLDNSFVRAGWPPVTLDAVRGVPVHIERQLIVHVTGGGDVDNAT